MAESGAGSGREDTQVSHTAKSDCVGEIDFKKLCHRNVMWQKCCYMTSAQVAEVAQ